MRSHLQQYARTQYWTRVYHATTQGHSTSYASIATGRSNICCHQVALPRRASARGHTTQLTQPSYLAHAFCANKVFHKQRVVGGSRRAWGIKKNTTHSSTSLQLFGKPPRQIATTTLTHNLHRRCRGPVIPRTQLSGAHYIR